MRVRISRVLIVCTSLAVATVPAEAQRCVRALASATRAQLDSAAAQCARDAADAATSPAERVQSSNAEQQLRERLRVGDFHVGDRIIVRIIGDTTSLDTLSVTPARALVIPQAGELSVDGVLRSELQARIDAQIARYLRTATVRVQPLTRLAVLGEIRTPGFVYVPNEALLSDVISAAGGLTPTGSLRRAFVRREGQKIVSSARFAQALTAGVTLDDLGVRAGDELVVGERRDYNFSQILQTTAILLGSTATFIAIRHR